MAYQSSLNMYIIMYLNLSMEMFKYFLSEIKLY